MQKQQTYDGTIKRELFREALSLKKNRGEFQYFLTAENIENIIQDAPKTADKKNIYWLALMEGILEGPRPDSAYTMVNMLMAKGLTHVQAHEQLSQLKKDKFFNMREEINFRSETTYDLNQLDVEVAKSDY